MIVLLPVAAWCQFQLRGLVLDAEKNTPLAGASVFLNTTSVGTVSNSQGQFELAIPAGRFELVTTSIGYERNVQNLSAVADTQRLNIRLQPKATELENVTVGAYEKDGWAKWGSFFIESFIGTSALAKNCTLRNKAAIRFRISKAENALSAVAFEPLIMENEALGYTVQYDLETFRYDFNTHYLLVQGYPLLMPMNGTPAKQKRWAARRRDAYQGSLMHFLRSVYRNQIAEQGFDMYALQKILNAERARVAQLYRTTSNAVLEYNKDSAAYYKKRLAEPAEFSVLGKTKLPGDSVAYAIDSVTAALDFPNYLLVSFRGKTAPAAFRAAFPDAGTALASQVTLLQRTPVAIQANGSFYDPANLLTLGYWAWWEKLATMLPFDYKP